MTYQQLIVHVAEGSSYTKRELRKILRLVSSAICNELAGGGEVVWNGLGALKNVPKAPHLVRNVFTGEHYKTKPSRRVKFTPSAKVRKQVRASIHLFQEPDLVQRYLPKENSGKIRSTDRPNKSGQGEGEERREGEDVGRPQLQCTPRSNRGLKAFRKGS